jgi:type II secretory pathway component PulF
MLSQQGLEVLTLTPSAKGRQAAGGLFNPVGGRALAEMTGQLALMLQTGNPLVQSLEALGEQATNHNLSVVLKAVANEITGGSSLALALGAHPRVFDGFYIAAVKAGESMGELPAVFKRMQAYLEKRVRLKSGVITAMIYPAIVSVLAVAAVVFVLTFVLPKFVNIFEKSSVALPLPTRMLMGISGFITGYWYLLFPGIAVLIVAGYFGATSRRGTLLLDRWILKLPVIGPLAKMIQSSVVLRTMGTLLEAGVPLVEALEVTKDACRNSLYRQFVSETALSLTQGEDLASTFARTDLMAPTIKQMVTTGDRTGNLPMVLNSVSDHLDEATDSQTKRLSAIVEPMLLIAMGVVVGFIAIAVLLPLFRLTSAARGGA